VSEIRPDCFSDDGSLVEVSWTMDVAASVLFLLWRQHRSLQSPASRMSLIPCLSRESDIPASIIWSSGQP
jgi:hypothetical protein